MPRLFDNRLAFCFVFSCLFLLFLPKINLISLEGETAGLRFDDLMLLCLSLPLFWAFFLQKSRFTGIESAIFIIVCFSLLSFSLNFFLVKTQILHVSSSIFYCLRLFEYFLFFYAGTMVSRFVSLEIVIKTFFLWNLLLMLLQKWMIIGIFTNEGYLPVTEDRVLGIASFGSEIGLLLNLLFCFFIYREKNSLKLDSPSTFFSRNFNYLLFFLFSYLVVLSGARMAIFALVISFLFSLKEFIYWNRPSSYIKPLIIVTAGTLLIPYFLYHQSYIIDRSEGLLSFNNLELISTVWDNIALDYNPTGKESVQRGFHDASWWIRIHKWCFALKTYSLHPQCWLQGVGPGFTMAALDGGFLRILTELGIIGSFLYGRLFFMISKQSRQLKWMMVSFLLNMIFFDVYLAYKPMSFLFLVLGATVYKNLDSKAVSLKPREKITLNYKQRKILRKEDGR